MLWSCSLTRVGITAGFHRRRVALLMTRPLRLSEMGRMVSEVELHPCLVSRMFPSEEEIWARLEEVVGREKADVLEIPTLGQLPMLPDLGAVDLVSLHLPCLHLLFGGARL